MARQNLRQKVEQTRKLLRTHDEELKRLFDGIQETRPYPGHDPSKIFFRRRKKLDRKLIENIKVLFPSS